VSTVLCDTKLADSSTRFDVDWGPSILQVSAAPAVRYRDGRYLK
jgi:hypothetical protein